MLAWMFNRQKSKDADNKDRAGDKLRELADIVRTVAPDEFSMNKPVATRSDMSARSSNPHDHSSPEDESFLSFAARIGADEDEYDDDDDAFYMPTRHGEDDSEARMDVSRRLRRHLPDITASQRMEMVDEFMDAIVRLADCYRPQVIALIEQELGHTPYLTRQAANRLRMDLANIGQVHIVEYVELLNDSDFLDLVRGRGEFTTTARTRDRMRANMAHARRAQDRNDATKVGLFARLRQGDEAPENVVEIAPHFDRSASRKNETPEERLLNGRDRLSRQAQRRMAHFIAASLFDTLVEEGRLRAEVARAVRQAVRQRIEKVRFDSRVARDTRPPVGEDIANADLSLEGNTFSDGPATRGPTVEQYVLDALARNDDEAVVRELARYGQLPPSVVAKILDSGSARAITAMAWRAGMSAQSAVVLQISSGIDEDALETPGTGGRFGMPRADMDWYIDFFTDPATPTAAETQAAAEKAAKKAAEESAAKEAADAKASKSPSLRRRFARKGD
ncbi:DUF2336 domain-containing protein [Thalassospira marina]|uniref:DUF2336 domain-containing protein n=1 Tax=Thalassospira marina TaxID=2048283 RepID=A0A2N3KRV5_9PROT|nr:DUF2336 domain-containing protein [Thalassospira marina]PKR53309.1 DUF2336 domain-containing protein [Thalassospira marina]